MAGFDLSTRAGRAHALVDFLWRDHAWIRLGFHNAFWVGPDLIRSNQPWPHQLRWWRDHGVRTVLDLRGEPHKSHHVLEEEACRRLGLTLVDLVVYSREAPTLEQVLQARRLFETMEYPCLVHCKSGADRAGLVSVLYAHFRMGQPIAEALAQLSLRQGHFRQGNTGVLDHYFARYLAETRETGEGLVEWMSRPDYDPAALKAEFRARGWAALLTDRLLRRE